MWLDFEILQQVLALSGSALLNLSKIMPFEFKESGLDEGAPK